MTLVGDSLRTRNLDDCMARQWLLVCVIGVVASEFVDVTLKDSDFQDLTMLVCPYVAHITEL